MEKWTHWGTSKKPLNEKTLTIEYFPDMREYDKTKLYETELTYTDGSKVKLFSSNDYVQTRQDIWKGFLLVSDRPISRIYVLF